MLWYYDVQSSQCSRYASQSHPSLEKDHLCPVCFPASVRPALSVTAIWPACLSHGHLCHIITFNWVIFRTSKQWTITTYGRAGTGRDRGSQRGWKVTHHRMLRSVSHQLRLKLDGVAVKCNTYTSHSCRPSSADTRQITRTSQDFGAHSDISGGGWNVTLSVVPLVLFTDFRKTAFTASLLWYLTHSTTYLTLLISLYIHPPRGVKPPITWSRSRRRESVCRCVVAVCWINSGCIQAWQLTLSLLLRVSAVLMQHSFWGKSSSSDPSFCNVASLNCDSLLRKFICIAKSLLGCIDVCICQREECACYWLIPRCSGVVWVCTSVFLSSKHVFCVCSILLILLWKGGSRSCICGGEVYVWVCGGGSSWWPHSSRQPALLSSLIRHQNRPVSSSGEPYIISSFWL